MTAPQLLVHDPLTRFIAQVAAIMLVSRALGLVLKRLGQPMVIAEIIAGILLGPSLLGWLFPEVGSALFATESLGVLQLISQLGLVLFMFLVGLELDPNLLRGRGHASVAISHTSIIVPFLLGAGLAVHLHPLLPESAHVPFSSFALFMGAAMSITAFPVLARILTERHLLRTRIGAVTIACAAVDDVTAWCLLAFVVASARSTGTDSAILTTVLAVAYILVMFWGVRPLLARAAARISGAKGPSQDVVAGTILLLFVSSWATELIGIHALFGAFLFGAILPKQGGFARSLAEKLEDVVLIVLLPLFFAYSGVRTQIGLLDSPGAWGLCAMVIGVACVGKFGGSVIAARLTGLSWRESSAIGILMNTRGLMELIVLNIGLDLGVIGPTLFTMMVLMALVTTFVTSPLLQLVCPPGLLERELAEEPTAVTPTVEERELRPVLICVTHRQSGPGLITLARALCEPAADIYALELIPPTNRASFYLDDLPESERASVLAPLLDHAAALGVPVKPVSFVSTEPGEDICRVAQVKGAGLVLTEWHRPLFTQSMLGGTVHRVLRDATADVGVFIDRGLSKLERILVPFQGTVHDRAALMLAQRIARSSGTHTTLLHVVKPLRDPRKRGNGESERAVETFREGAGEQVELHVVEHDAPADVALAESHRGYDLVIVGMGREWGLEPRLFGVQPERLMLESRTSLLVVRHHAAVAPRPLGLRRGRRLATQEGG